MKLIILFVVVVGAILVWWLRSVKPKRREGNIIHCGDDLPANRCNGQFRAGGKYQPAPDRR
jgi:hypothetical protein